MEVSLIPFLVKAVPRAAAALVASSLVVSCATSTDAPQATAAGRNPSVAADVNLERVVLQAYRAIGDRHLFEPNFRSLSTETYRGFASTDPSMVLETSDGTFTVKRDGREVLSRPTPADPTDGRAWGAMLAELMAGFARRLAGAAWHRPPDADPRGDDGHHQAARPQQPLRRPEEARDNRFQRDGGGGVGITVERTDDKRIMIRAVQDGSPAAKAGVQVGDQILSIDGESMIEPAAERRRRQAARLGRRAGRHHRDARLARRPIRAEHEAQPHHPDHRHLRTPRRRRLIHLTGFNSATTDNLKARSTRRAPSSAAAWPASSSTCAPTAAACLDQAQTVSELFINNGTIFSTSGRHPDSRRTYKSAWRKTPDMPIVVLMNGGSASAAEIVAAALQDRGRAVVVGSTSYGKGTVQTVVRLANEGELILTWSRLNAPSGYTWNELGVLPNICTSKIADIGQLSPTAVDSSQGTLMRWHALRNPTHQEVSDLRKICPPGEPARSATSRSPPGCCATARSMPKPCRQRPSRRRRPRRLPPANRRLDIDGPATSLPAFRRFALRGIGTRPWPSRPRS
jgi:carboxyl-terminal processing protease